jgi:hypothetical protein
LQHQKELNAQYKSHTQVDLATDDAVGR